MTIKESIKSNIANECNAYMDEWNFENWGVKYWSKTTELADYLRTH